MNGGNHYRARAAALDAMAQLEQNPRFRAEWETMAKAYRRLAELADHNSQTDIVYEPPPMRLPIQQGPQQQQQAQPKKEG